MKRSKPAAASLPVAKPKRVALIIESMMAPRRAMMNGVARYMQEHEPWLIYLKPAFAEKSLSRWVHQWNGDGIITVINEQEHGVLSNVDIPVVDLLGQVPERGFPLVRTNDYAVGRMGAEHLLERGFRHFGFCEFGHLFWSKRRREGFETTVRKAGFDCQVYDSLPPAQNWGGPEAWEDHQNRFMQWIERLPKPVGVMTTNDGLGQQVLEACMRLDVRVPESVGVIGADNDEPICRISTPELSSVIIDDPQRGYEAAALLARLMAGAPKPNEPTLIEPIGIAQRASTDFFAIDDELLSLTLHHIRQVACTRVSVNEVAEAVNVSRSQLERRFRQVLRRSVNDEIIRVRLNRAIDLLVQTKLELKHIATRCGFSSQAYMSTVFKERLGRTPGSYR